MARPGKGRQLKPLITFYPDTLKALNLSQIRNPYLCLHYPSLLKFNKQYFLLHILEKASVWSVQVFEGLKVALMLLIWLFSMGEYGWCYFEFLCFPYAVKLQIKAVSKIFFHRVIYIQLNLHSIQENWAIWSGHFKTGESLPQYPICINLIFDLSHICKFIWKHPSAYTYPYMEIQDG